MIERLKNYDNDIARSILKVFQESYKIEAALLKTKDFPPLKRPLEDYINTKTVFYGCYKNLKLAGVIEININSNFTHINSLVVSPAFFRQGIASKLMTYVLGMYDTNLFSVETGLDNKPATCLYKSFNFKEVKQWDTDYGIRKVKFELKR